MAIPFIMQWLLGTWFIVASDAPIWQKGDKYSPTLTYTLKQESDTYKLLDETKYVKNGKHKVITGYDKQVSGNDSSFLWRGKGMLFFVTSKWRVCFRDNAGEWAVIAYTKTMFTPEGIDILSRKPSLDAATMANIHSLIAQDSTIAKHISGLVPIIQK